MQKTEVRLLRRRQRVGKEREERVGDTGSSFGNGRVEGKAGGQHQKVLG